MFKVGDKVTGNNKMMARSNWGRKATVVVVHEANNSVDVMWEDGTNGYGIQTYKLGRQLFPKPPNAAQDVASIGAEVLATLTERGKQYDASGKEAERSMSKVVAAFNIITGQDLTEVQGWEFMQVLKQVRFFQNTGAVHRDSLIDDVAYALLKSEAALNG